MSAWGGLQTHTLKDRSTLSLCSPCLEYWTFLRHRAYCSSLRTPKAERTRAKMEAQRIVQHTPETAAKSLKMEIKNSYFSQSMWQRFSETCKLYMIPWAFFKPKKVREKTNTLVMLNLMSNEAKTVYNTRTKHARRNNSSGWLVWKSRCFPCLSLSNSYPSRSAAASW